ncbi:site-specific integrase, partial [Falsiroseomonas sp. E2-1-a20]|uniref:site-specific integrase n=1 Tax=Falsiroseomonas sp. E2-1-a20 TaxID=3239300 RepID=UPI003F3D4A47
ELEALFGSPLFQGAKSKLRPYDLGDYLVDDWMFWAPLIALFTGARIGEIAQLRPNDVRVVDGLAVVDINENGEKTLKNQGTARLIPVHGRLVEIGLVRLAAQQQAVKARMLLPGIPGPVLGDPGKAPGAWMSERLLPRLNLKTRKGLGFHSLRHTLKTLLRNVQVPDSISNELCGHDDRGRSGVGAGYGRVEVSAMKDGLEKISLPKAVALIKPRCM